MKRVIIVGGGLAGMVLAFRLHEEGIPFTLIDNPSLSSSSRVAAGLWNPLVFKRMSKSWMAEDLVQELHRFFKACEQKTDSRFLSKRISIKPFTEDQEKLLWKKRVEQELSAFADTGDYQGIPEGYEACKFTNGYGRIFESGNVNINAFLEAGKTFFKEKIITEDFDYTQIQIEGTKVKYKNLEAEALVFCEGHLVKHNPYFSWIPLKPAKGEILHIEAPDLKFKNGVYNRNGFILDVGPGKFSVGSTYNWTDLNDEPSTQGLNELKDRLGQMINCNYSVKAHLAGVRPSSIDRRPIIGAHPQYKNLFVFNGLGAKGVMLAPYFAGKFVHFLKQNQELPPEVNVARFYKLYAA
jgi:glycine oxidase